MAIVRNVCFLICAFVASLFTRQVYCGESQVNSISYYNLRKAVSSFEAVLLKFDESYPSNVDKDKQYKQAADDLKFTNNVLLAEMKVPYRGTDEKEETLSEERKFAESLDATKSEDFPVIYLFKKGQLDEPLRFAKEDFDSSSIREFVRANVPNVHLLLESCVESLDQIANKFSRESDESKRKVILKEGESQVAKLQAQNEKESGKIYIKVMERVLERGNMFLKSEQERIKNLLSGKMSDTKKKQLQNRLNILESFQSGIQSKDEL